MYKSIKKDLSDRTYYIRINSFDSEECIKKGFVYCKIGKVITGQVLIVLTKNDGVKMTIDQNGGCLRLNSKSALCGLLELLGIVSDDSELHLRLICNLQKIAEKDDMIVFSVDNENKENKP